LGHQSSCLLEVRGLFAAYGTVTVLFGVSVSVQQGEALAVIGPNGAGKTTLLRTVSGFLHPTAGEVWFEARNIGKVPPHAMVQLGVSQVLQGRQVLATMTVRENLLLGAHLRLVRSGRRGALETLGAVNKLFPILDERKRMLAGSLSGGEQQMLAIGRALMASPKLLLLDEPSLGLAPLVVAEIARKLCTLMETGLTMTIVEQNPEVAFAIGTNCCVMQAGRVVVSGAVQAIKTNEVIADLYLGAAAASRGASPA
jgi:branched-chain amino acid transport system ATP-binding protein